MIMAEANTVKILAQEIIAVPTRGEITAITGITTEINSVKKDISFQFKLIIINPDIKIIVGVLFLFTFQH